MSQKDASSEKIDLTGKRKVPVSGKLAKNPNEAEAAITGMMMDARYIRQSSALIQESLQKGFDILQLPNGDIVTTGTKTIVYQYTWDDERGKLVRVKPGAGEGEGREIVDVVEELENGKGSFIPEEIDA